MQRFEIHRSSVVVLSVFVVFELVKVAPAGTTLSRSRVSRIGRSHCAFAIIRLSVYRKSLLTSYSSSKIATRVFYHLSVLLSSSLPHSASSSLRQHEIDDCLTNHPSINLLSNRIENCKIDLQYYYKYKLPKHPSISLHSKLSLPIIS